MQKPPASSLDFQQTKRERERASYSGTLNRPIRRKWHAFRSGVDNEPNFFKSQEEEEIVCRVFGGLNDLKGHLTS